MSRKLLVNEIYGPTIQGEGPSLGRPCSFLRVAACNLACVWCDTFYTWDFTRVNKEDEVHPMETSEVVEKVAAVLPPGENPLLVISGGEPMLQQERLVEVMHDLPASVDFEIETAGTIAPTAELIKIGPAFNVSLKLEHSGNSLEKRYKAEAIDALMDSGLVQGWKFVAQSPSDLLEVDALVKVHDLFPVYIMPEGVTREELERHSRALIDSVIARGWRMTPRLHIQMWGNERGH